MEEGNCTKKTRRRYDRDFKISVVAELEAGKPLAQVARKYGIHPSLPCRWKAELAENPESSDLNDQIQEIALDFPYYGCRRITAELKNRGYVVSRKRVLRLMRQEKLLCHKKKFKPITTDSTHGLPIYPNLLSGKEITGLNQAWASDITYVQLQHEHIFLAVVLDLYSRKYIGWCQWRYRNAQLWRNKSAQAYKYLPLIQLNLKITTSAILRY
jgi:putative transposase